MKKVLVILFLLVSNLLVGQNTIVGDGFGGRLWYSPSNFGVGSYSAFSLCSENFGGSVNRLLGWGNNASHNHLGLGSTVVGSIVPIQIPFMSDVQFFAAGYMNGAIKTDSTGWAWGENFTGSPIQVIADVKFLSASQNTVTFVKNDGTVWSVANNYFGNFGDGVTSLTTYTFPIQMQGVSNAVRVANNQRVTIVLLSDSTLVSVGSDPGGGGRLGLGSNIQTYTPLPITGIPKILDIKSNRDASIALTDSGQVYYWGNIFGVVNIPTVLPILSDIVAISGCDDGNHFLMLDANKNCYAYGKNLYGQCGLPIVSNSFIATPTLIATNVVDIMAGESFSYILKSNGTLWATGQSSGPGTSIWLNLTDTIRDYFAEIDPNQVSGSCKVLLTNIESLSAHTTFSFPNIYPNPTSTNFIIEGLDQPYNLTIYNAVGQMLYTQNNISANNKSVDVSKYSKGLLFIRVESADEVYYHKLIKE